MASFAAIFAIGNPVAFDARAELRETRAYWFEFDDSRDLVDTDVPEQDDGSAAAAMADDARAFLFDDIMPEWAQ